jgi:hypothetical protein
MSNITSSGEELDIEQEFLTLVNDHVRAENIKLEDVARVMGADRPMASRALRGLRKFTYPEVVRISQSFGIRPSRWNTIGNPDPESRFLPVLGNIAASVWRVKGFAMPQVLSPIRPINTGEDDVREQHCYFVNRGTHSGEYAVCVDVNVDALEDGDIVVVEETRPFPPADEEVVETTSRVVLYTEDGVSLVHLDDELVKNPMPYPNEAIEIKALVIGFYRAVREKKRFESQRHVDSPSQKSQSQEVVR